MDYDHLIQTIRDLSTTVGIRIVASLAIFFAGRTGLKILLKFTKKIFDTRKIDETISKFLESMLSITGNVIIFLAILNQLGIQTTSFVALIGAAGLALGLALQGALSNFAAGVLLLLFRPFKTGDVIETGSSIGVVESISLLATVIMTADNRKIIVPNGKVMSDRIINYTTTGTRRIDMIIGISYSDDIRVAKKILEEISAGHELVLKDKDITVGVESLGDSSVNLAVRPWVLTENYWSVKFSLLEKFKYGLEEAGISIPFPQTDIHLYKTEN
ncbi:MAG: mechanosensitive ion channel [Deltaproteobacteria bacterium]|nr:mechanosensitive ion channel [Deltaproteobacteria bacterium]